MSGSQTALKVFAILGIIFGVIGIFVSVLVFAGAANSANAVAVFKGNLISLGATGVMLGVLILIESVVQIVIGWLGLRGANDPSKIGPFYVLCWIAVILQVVSAVLGLVGGREVFGVLGSLIGGLVIPVILLVLANNIKKQA